MEAEKLALERQQVSRFPVEERAISLKRAAAVPAGLPPKKRLRPSLPPNPAYNPAIRKNYVPQPKAGTSISNASRTFHPRPFRNPLHPPESEAQQTKARQAKAQPARAQQSKVEQGGQKRKAASLATAAKVNFKKPKLNIVPKPFAPSTSSSGGNTGSAPNSRNR